MKPVWALALLLVLASGCSSPQSTVPLRGAGASEPVVEAGEAPAPMETNDVQGIGVGEEIGTGQEPADAVIETNGVRHLASVKLEDILQGCFGKDCIPSIDVPKFESVAAADEWLRPQDFVMTVEVNGDKRAYPLPILDLHEIVNDVVGGKPIAVTYCPLCGSGLVFERVLDGETVEFGVSGMLYNSDLVMYDRKTETWWEQITGTGIVGELSGKTLGKVPVKTLEWGSFRDGYPGAKVLSRDTGIYPKDRYGYYPYGDYQETRDIFFNVAQQDDRLHPKTPVHGIEIGGEFKAYTEKAVKEAGYLNDGFAGKKLFVYWHPMDETVIVLENDSGKELVLENGRVVGADAAQLKEVPSIRLFWFAWFAFHPQTEAFLG